MRFRRIGHRRQAQAPVSTRLGSGTSTGSAPWYAGGGKRRGGGHEDSNPRRIARDLGDLPAATDLWVRPAPYYPCALGRGGCKRLLTPPLHILIRWGKHHSSPFRFRLPRPW